MAVGGMDAPARAATDPTRNAGRNATTA